MSGYWKKFIFLLDMIEVAAKSINQSVFSLTNVLFVASFASDTVNQIAAFAGDIVFA
jgi:hypothetical protein